MINDSVSKFLRLFIKGGLCFLIIFVHIVLGLISSLIPSSKLKRLVRVQSCHRLAKLMLKVLGIHVEGHPRIPEISGPVMAVANHVGYIDIVLFLSQVPCVFITSQELGSNPIMGPIARYGGSFMVDRKNKFGLKEEIRRIEALMNEGFPIFLFPEATSFDGSGILPFKRALLESAVRARAVIFPFCINYLRVDNEALNVRNRDTVCFYGEAVFISHLKGLVETKRIDVEVLGLAPVSVGEGDDSRSLCQKLETEIKQAHKPVAA